MYKYLYAFLSVLSSPKLLLMSTLFYNVVDMCNIRFLSFFVIIKYCNHFYSMSYLSFVPHVSVLPGRLDRVNRVDSSSFLLALQRFTCHFSPSFSLLSSLTSLGKSPVFFFLFSAFFPFSCSTKPVEFARSPVVNFDNLDLTVRICSLHSALKTETSFCSCFLQSRGKFCVCLNLFYCYEIWAIFQKCFSKFLSWMLSYFANFQIES